MKQNDRLNVDNEALWIEQASRGDTQSFGRLYDMHVNRIYRYILYRVSDVGCAEDLTQEVFVRGYKAIHKYKKTRSPFIGWLMTIAHNLIIDHYRSRKRELSLEDQAITSNPATNPQSIAEARWEQERIRSAITKLRPDQQHVIVLHFIEGFEYPEIAALLKKNEGAIRVIQHRALKELRCILGKEID